MYQGYAAISQKIIPPQVEQGLSKNFILKQFASTLIRIRLNFLLDHHLNRLAKEDHVSMVHIYTISGGM